LLKEVVAGAPADKVSASSRARVSVGLAKIMISPPAFCFAARSAPTKSTHGAAGDRLTGAKKARA
jgi:hypothetical protein